MKYTTVEVELDHGRVRPRHPGQLPNRARALLTLVEDDREPSLPPLSTGEAGLQRFLSMPDFKLTQEQLRASMDADGFDQ